MLSDQSEQLLSEAINKFNAGEHNAAMALLQKSADSGNSRAALFYADNLYQTDKV